MDPGWRHGETPVVATAQHPGAVVMVSAHTVIEFGLMHHQELQAENQQVRRVMAAPAPFPAFPGVVRRTRSWLIYSKGSFASNSPLSYMILMPMRLMKRKMARGIRPILPT